MTEPTRAQNILTLCRVTLEHEAEIARLRAINADLLAALKAALPYLEHSLKFYRYQQAGHEFWPNREEAEGNIRDGEAALAKAKEVK